MAVEDKTRCSFTPTLWPPVLGISQAAASRPSISQTYNVGSTFDTSSGLSVWKAARRDSLPENSRLEYRVIRECDNRAAMFAVMKFANCHWFEKPFSAFVLVASALDENFSLNWPSAPAAKAFPSRISTLIRLPNSGRLARLFNCAVDSCKLSVLWTKIASLWSQKRWTPGRGASLRGMVCECV